MLFYLVFQNVKEMDVKNNRFLFLYQVKIKKGGQTVTAVFNEDIPAWPLGQWYSGKF